MQQNNAWHTSVGSVGSALSAAFGPFGIGNVSRVFAFDPNLDGQPDEWCYLTTGTIWDPRYMYIGARKWPIDVASDPVAATAVLADLDGDGNSDIIAVDNVSASVFILYRTGVAPEPRQAITLAGNPRVGGVAAADFNGDKKIDLAVSIFDVNHITGGVQLFLQP